MKKTILILLILITNFSFSQDVLFKTSKKALVLKNDTINMDENNNLILIPGGRMFRKYFEKINFFKEVKVEEDFIKELANINPDEFKDAKDGAEVYKIFNNKFKKFLIFQILSDREKQTITMKLHKPDYGDLFIVEGKTKIQVIGITAGTTYIPDGVYDSMMNELVNYLRTNSDKY